MLIALEEQQKVTNVTSDQLDWSWKNWINFVFHFHLVMTQFIFVVRRKDETSLEIGSEITGIRICECDGCALERYRSLNSHNKMILSSPGPSPSPKFGPRANSKITCATTTIFSSCLMFAQAQCGLASDPGRGEETADWWLGPGLVPDWGPQRNL